MRIAGLSALTPVLALAGCGARAPAPHERAAVPLHGQVASNGRAIPRLLGAELGRRFGVVFVQADPHPARAGERVVTRFQLDRHVTGGDLHDWLVNG